MKKKKSGDQSPADFKNNPFTPLRGFSTRSPSARMTGTGPRRKEEQSEDDGSLFLRAVSGARKIEKEEDPAPGPVTRKIEEKRDAEDHELFLQAMQKIRTAPQDRQSEQEELDEPGRRPPSSRMRQLKRGTIRISGELDLHGFLRDEALVRLEHYIAGAYSRGQDAVLVITGKGVNSPEGPVLRGATSAWLGGRGKRMVAEFSPAPRDKGGSGAFVVFLKKK
jgi:DNA-nicking Smr family endonuclease